MVEYLLYLIHAKMPSFLRGLGGEKCIPVFVHRLNLYSLSLSLSLNKSLSFASPLIQLNAAIRQTQLTQMPIILTASTSTEIALSTCGGSSTRLCNNILYHGEATTPYMREVL